MEYKKKSDIPSILRNVPLRLDTTEEVIGRFKENVEKLFNEINDDQVELTQRGFLRTFLENTYFKGHNIVAEEYHNIDLAILGSNDSASNVNVIIEVKSTTNKREMPEADNLSATGFYETIFYYMTERDKRNNDITFIIITNLKEWFLIDAHEYERLFWTNNYLKREYKNFANGTSSIRTRKKFYEEVIATFVDSCQSSIEYVYFRLFDKTINRDGSAKSQVKAVCKLLSPNFLLKRYEPSDANHLNTSFYQELLYIMGLEEVRVGNINVIKRKGKGDRQPGSLIENAILAIKKTNTSGLVSLEDGDDDEDRYFDSALNLVITWINRILFLKLLEAQLVRYHNGDRKYEFLNIGKIKSYDDLDDLFFLVLAKPEQKRPDFIKKKFPGFPYLNSSLFETTREEVYRAMISNLNDNYELKLYSKSVLKGYIKKFKKKLSTLEYVFMFLDSYNFGSDTIKSAVVGELKPLISASVLGLIFEKINGYREGSIFTPSNITMEMCRFTIRKNFIDRINRANEKDGWKCKNITEVYNKLTTDKLKACANDIINNTHICDPSVGSGHFLVSSLNELIALKSELGILTDKDGKSLRDVKIDVYNDELLIRDSSGNIINYVPSRQLTESQRIQETIFNEKRNIIENCLFGVDININSVNICRLRLWIELLKSTYYNRETGKLCTLPNIDINIKCGNSLVSHIPVKVGGEVEWKNKFVNYSFSQYRELVHKYRNNDDKATEIQLEKQIDLIRRALSGSKQQNLFGTDWQKDYNDPYDEALEWMVEFPDIIDDDGIFTGFDIVIGNPPYIHLESIGKKMSKFYKEMSIKLEKGKLPVPTYKTYDAQGDIYTLFFELGKRLARKNGLIGYITSNKWMTARYGKNTRSFISEELNPVLLVDFDKVKVFDKATVEPDILVMENAANSHACHSVVVGKSAYNELRHEIEQGTIVLDFNDKPWYIQNTISSTIRQKASEAGIALEDDIWKNKISRGVTTGNNDAFIINGDTRKRILESCTSDEERERTDKLLKKIVAGKDVQKYTCKWNDTYLISTFPALDYDIDAYPAVKSYLLSFAKETLMENGYEYIANDDALLNEYCYKRLQQTGETVVIDGRKIYLTADTSAPEKSRKRSSNKWFETQDNIAFYADFNEPKVIWKRIGSDLRFAYDNTGLLGLDSTCILSGPYAKYICGILNTPIAHFMLSFSPHTGTGDLLISVQAIMPLRIPFPTKEEKECIEKMVDSLKDNYNAETEALLNRKALELYHITDISDIDLSHLLHI